MKNLSTKWVLGHKIIPVEVTGNYDLVMGETPSNVPGPPPHYHSNYTEVFLITEGQMEFVVDGKITILKAGESVNLPPKTMHTFNNKSNSVCKWVNIHSPKGFLSFFNELGIPEYEVDAMNKSVEDTVIQKVLDTAASYDMYIRV